MKIEKHQHSLRFRRLKIEKANIPYDLGDEK